MSTARSVNKVIIIGNLTRAPQLRKVGANSVVATFGVATNAAWRDAEGNLQERAEFHNVVAWNKLAEICAQILNVGMLVYLDGELRTRVWNDENSKRRYRTEIKINDMKLLDAKDKKGVGVDKAYELGSKESEEGDVENVYEETPVFEAGPEVEESKTDAKKDAEELF